LGEEFATFRAGCFTTTAKLTSYGQHHDSLSQFSGTCSRPLYQRRLYVPDFLNASDECAKLLTVFTAAVRDGEFGSAQA
jgi:hypothetical protein